MKFLKVIFAALAVVLCASSAQAALPSVKLKDLKGKTVDMAQLDNGGKPMIISFFASWCKPCKRELNAISELYPDWVDETGVKLVAISCDKAQDAAKVKSYVDSEGWEYEILLDPNSDFMRAMGIQYPVASKGTSSYITRNSDPVFADGQKNLFSHNVQSV